jgi:hypothetical protein
MSKVSYFIQFNMLSAAIEPQQFDHTAADGKDRFEHNREDKLYIELLHLCSNHESLIAQLHNTSRTGYMHLGKSKYIMGPQNVGQNQYDLRASNATSTVAISESGPLTLEHGDGPDPLAMFGILAPPSLKSAQTNFKTSLELMIAVVNNRSRINDITSTLTMMDI